MPNISWSHCVGALNAKETVCSQVSSCPNNRRRSNGDTQRRLAETQRHLRREVCPEKSKTTAFRARGRSCQTISKHDRLTTILASSSLNTQFVAPFLSYQITAQDPLSFIMSVAEKGIILAQSEGGVVVKWIAPERETSEGSDEDQPPQEDKENIPAFTKCPSVQTFLDWRREDLQFKLGPKHAFNKRVVPRTIGKLAEPGPVLKKPTEYYTYDAKKAKHRIHKGSVAAGECNEAQYYLRKSWNSK